MVLGLKTVFLKLLHAKQCRIIWKLPQKTSFGPEACEICSKVLRKVYGKYTESSKTSKTCPGRPIWAHMGPEGAIYGPIRAHMGLYMGP